MDLITALLYWVFRVMALKVIVLELGTWVNAASGYYMERRDTGVKVKERTERSWWAIKAVDCSEEICCWWLNCPRHKMAPWHNPKIKLLMFVVYLHYIEESAKIYTHTLTLTHTHMLGFHALWGLSTRIRILDIAIFVGTFCPHNVGFTRTTHTHTLLCINKT